jgi:hypothetical protein
MKNCSTFAASSPNSFYGLGIAVAVFVAACLLSAKDKGLSIRDELLHSCCNLSLATWRGDSLSYFKNYNFSFMPNSMKDYSTAKNSTRTVTPDCESVNPSNQLNQLNQLNLLPKQVENEQGIGSVDSSDVVGNNLSGSDNDVLSQTVSDSESSIAIGNDANGSDIKVSPQANHNVQENHSTTGNNFQYNGNTINIYQCPQELIDLLVKSINKNL